jgi:hypothetical protein
MFSLQPEGLAPKESHGRDAHLLAQPQRHLLLPKNVSASITGFVILSCFSRGYRRRAGPGGFKAQGGGFLANLRCSQETRTATSATAAKKPATLNWAVVIGSAQRNCARPPCQ